MSVTERSRSGGSSRLASIGLLAAAVMVFLVVAELLIRWIEPQPSLYPRYGYSEEYGFLPPANSVMVHEMPGRWHFEYTTNRFGHRGPALPISNVYTRPNVVVLGDSYTFGQGVDDGEEYSAVMDKLLGGRVGVANLSSPGWGLTQEIRRYYELGQLWHPRIVVLEFCSNDPADDLLTEVTRVVDGRFEFVPNPNSMHSFKRYLSDSWLQKSQLYNLARSALYNRIAKREVEAAMHNENGGKEPSPAERLYVRLFEPFARDLHDKGVSLVVLSVGHDIARFPLIQETAERLDREGVIRLLRDVDGRNGEWLDVSAEGGHWGPRTQHLVGQNLAEVVGGMLK
ncbi:MAG: hypothetical protein GC151_18900 [Betaproteobacteria bacterium]|nr:hypothetical protein [Betaproteobacteria bacterium]